MISGDGSAPALAAYRPAASSCLLTHLPNGLRIAVESLPDVRSAAVGIWVCSGSRQETSGLEGAAHLWEHMAFKGTTRRSALDIAMALDRLGGLSNAFTGREETCFHARVVDTGVAEAFDILADLVLHPLLDARELKLEKDVVRQEIAAVDETPEEYAFETFWKSLWADPALAHPILGTVASVNGLSRAKLLEWRQRWHAPERLIVAACGAVDANALVAAAERAFGGLPSGPAAAPAPAAPRFRPRALAEERDSEQCHVFLAFPAPGLTDPRRYAVSCLATLLGGQLSSRLFQEVREKRGLAYSISASPHFLSDCGVLEIYAAAQPDRTDELLHVLRGELEAIAGCGGSAKAVTEDELDRAREHLTGLLYLGAESTEERMLRLARNVAVFGRQVELDEAAAALAAVTLDDVRAAARELARLDKAALCVVGPSVDPAWAETFGTSFERP
ncbi:peptidase M16 domain protein [Desulfovibrio sp. X2]|uniref:M16 family metallopeptidase n=1 Tax=Desulfovibrio sp. X2 TaxID=941449 RepID=UPI000358B918|nr:pitrilysin family protein [Desulfovibrio sp. X2]EPR42471.1 peptidase M16 domain protein [Desulfovibrio sp. X2]